MTIRSILRAGLVVALLAPASRGALAQDSGACRDALQGKIARNRKGDRSWDDATIQRLCAQVPSAEPARCFERVMHGGINWGHGTRWTTEMAISLCKGSTDAAKTIECFEDQLLHAVEFKDAIDRCARRTRRPPEPAAVPDPAASSAPPAPPALPTTPTTAPQPELPRTTPPASRVLASLPASPVAADPEGALAGDCGGERELLCAYLVQACVPVCEPDSSAARCRQCVTGSHTMGIDCWSCLYGGSAASAGRRFACRDFVCTGGDGGANPRVRDAGSAIGEECGPCRRLEGGGRSFRHCCLVAR